MSKKLDDLIARIDALTPRVEAVEKFQAEHGDDAAAISAAAARVSDLESRVGAVEAAEAAEDLGTEPAEDLGTEPADVPAVTDPADPTSSEAPENSFVV